MASPNNWNIILSDEPTQKRKANRISLVFLLTMGVVSIVWFGFSAYIAPHFVTSAHYAAWHRKDLRLREYFWFFGLLVVLVFRPEFRKAVWGDVNEVEFAPSARDKPEPHLWRDRAIVFILYIALALVFTLPNSIHPTQSLLGRGGDNYLHAWFLWEFARAVAHGQNPFHTSLILYPMGANLAWATTDILGQIMAMPFSLTLGPIFTYNLSLVLQLALAAFFAHLLCQHVSGDAAAATIGGMLFGFSPFLLAHARGHLSLVTAFPLPVYVLALGRLLGRDKPSWRDGALLGLALALVALANYEYALIFLLFTLVILAIDLGGVGLPMVEKLWMPLLTSAAVCLFCLAPILLMMLKDYGVTKPAPLEDATSYSADAWSFFVPSPEQFLFGHYVRELPAQFFVGPGGIEGIEFIGLTALVFAVIGCWVARGNQRRWAGRAMVAGIVFALMSLGPKIHILGRSFSLPAPAAPLYKLSVMRFLREPARLSIVTILCASLLASIGMAFTFSKLKIRWKRSVFACVIGAIVLLEYLAYPFPSSSIVQPARYWVIPKTTQRCTLPPSIRGGAVLTIPLDDWWHFNDAMWMQMMDGGRYSLIDGRVSPYIPGQAWNSFIDNTPFLASLHRESQSGVSSEAEHQPPAGSLASPSDEKLVADLVKQLDLRAAVVFDASERPADVSYVRQVFGGTESSAGTCEIFVLPRSRIDSSDKGGQDRVALR